MGKCIKCGKETNCSYPYYSAIRMGSDTKITSRGKETTITYINFQEHSAFYCRRCDSSVVTGIFMTLFYLAITILIIYFADMDFLGICGVAFFGVLTLYGAIASVVAFFGIKKDKRKRSDNLPENAMKEIKKQAQDSGRSFFSSDEYKKLK